MKKFFSLMCAAALLLVSCSEKEEPVKKVSAVTLDKTSVTLKVGETSQLTATITPADAKDKTLTWTSSKESVATVSEEGLVTAIALGDAVVTVSSKNGKTATCAVKVEKTPVASITLNATEKEFDKIGQTFQLTATVLPDDATDKTVTWKSSKTSVATVSGSGLITTTGYGEATITASCGGKEATCAVTVTAIPVTSVTLNPASKSGVIGDTFQITATVKPDDAVDKTLTWSSTNTAVATVDNNGNVKMVGVGDVEIKATAKSGAVGICAVHVDPINVSEVSLNVTEKTFTALGETLQLTASVLPANATYQTITWSTTDATVATVSNAGLVTAAGYGTATITATSHNGKTATCDITVQKQFEITAVNYTVGGVTKNALEAPIYTYPGAQITLTPVDNEAETGITYQITTDSGVITASGNVLTFDAASSSPSDANHQSRLWSDATITVTASNGKNVTFKVYCSLTSGFARNGSACQATDPLTQYMIAAEGTMSFALLYFNGTDYSNIPVDAYVVEVVGTPAYMSASANATNNTYVITAGENTGINTIKATIGPLAMDLCTVKVGGNVVASLEDLIVDDFVF